MRSDCQESKAVSSLKQWIDSHSKILEDPWSDVECCQPEVSTLQHQHDGSGVCIDPTYDREDEEESEWTGKYDKQDNLVGYGTLRLYDGDTFTGSYDNGQRSGWGIVTSPLEGVSALTGDWKDNELSGKVKLVTPDTSVLEGWCTQSRLNGPVRRIDMKKFRTFRQQVCWLGRYKNGVAYGQCWEWKEGGAWLTGDVDEHGKFTGNSVAFLYPDLQTALLGQFDNGVMVAASPARLVKINIVNDIAVPTFEKLKGDSVGYSLSTITSVGLHPLVPDPYEQRTCKVQKSQVEGGGEGLYAVRDIEKGEVVAFYNGVRLPYKPGTKEVWETSGYKIFVNADYKSGERIDLPGELIHLKNYCATLGHKINHCFVYNCTEWFFSHPRHGLVPCVVSTRKIHAGEEFLLHYGYDPLNCPSWYREALDEFLIDKPELDLWKASDPMRMESDEVTIQRQDIYKQCYNL